MCTRWQRSGLIEFSLRGRKNIEALVDLQLNVSQHFNTASKKKKKTKKEKEKS